MCWSLDWNEQHWATDVANPKRLLWCGTHPSLLWCVLGCCAAQPPRCWRWKQGRWRRERRALQARKCSAASTHWALRLRRPGRWQAPQPRPARMRRGRPDGVHSRCVVPGVVVAMAAAGVRLRRASTMVAPLTTHEAEMWAVGWWQQRHTPFRTAHYAGSGPAARQSSAGLALLCPQQYLISTSDVTLLPGTPHEESHMLQALRPLCGLNPPVLKAPGLSMGPLNCMSPPAAGFQ